MYTKKEYSQAITSYQNVLQINSKNVDALVGIYSSYWLNGDFSDALTYAQQAYQYATDSTMIAGISSDIKSIQTQQQDQQDKVNNSVTNDPFSYKQYYLKMLNIPAAWAKVGYAHYVLVAVIDSGVDTNHLDLTNHIWIPKGGSVADIPNFSGDNYPSNIPTTNHGTMVAGIISASISNNIGIAGIADGYIMPLQVSKYDGSGNLVMTSTGVSVAIHYAVDHGANIINLSLGSNEFV